MTAGERAVGAEDPSMLLSFLAGVHAICPHGVQFHLHLSLRAGKLSESFSMQPNVRLIYCLFIALSTSGLDA